MRWIKKNKFLTGLIVFLSFITPLIIVHFLFKYDSGNDLIRAEWTAGDVLAYIAGFLAFIGTISLGALALWQNQQIYKQHMENLAPALSMNLISFDGMLFLTVENTGQTEAHEVNISVEWIENNGENNTLTLDDLFLSTFELYPNEKAQGRVAFSGENISTSIFPQIAVTVSYKCPRLNNKQEHYARRVIYDNGYKQRVTADVNIDNRKIESDVTAMARAVVRMANYLDGRQVAVFDELNILAGKSLRNDIVEAIKTKEEVSVLSRTETIMESMATRIIPEIPMQENDE